ncbi:S8 family serine peptidase [Desulfofundulus sp.]|uniref:S8 family serine peptidase n=1 Tax=Desulfofundulus sp. TaxID=2282750 RepID=UPI003C73022B
MGLLFAFAALGLPVPAGAIMPPAGNAAEPDRVIVKFKAGVSETVISETVKRSIHSRHGGKVIRDLPASLGAQVVEVPAGKAEEKVDEYQKESAVEFAEPDYVAKALEIPNDPYFPKQWDMDNIGQTGGKPGADIEAYKAWDVTSGNPSVEIAILDSGIDQDHEDLASKISSNVNFYNQSNI